MKTEMEPLIVKTVTPVFHVLVVVFDNVFVVVVESNFAVAISTSVQVRYASILNFIPLSP